MNLVDFSLIGAGSFPYGDKDVFGAMQDYYFKMVLATLKDKIGSYDSTRIYVFGKSDYVFSFGATNITFQSPTGGYALLNDVIYELPVMASPMVGGTDYLKTDVNYTTKIFSDGAPKDFLVQNVLEVGTSSDISINKITPIDVSFNLGNGGAIGLGTYIKVTKSGKTICLNSALSDSGSGNIGTLPVGLRPLQTIEFMSTNTTPRKITINTDGTITTIENESSGHRFCFTFVI